MDMGYKETIYGDVFHKITTKRYATSADSGPFLSDRLSND
jgi:hypothetical protein